MNDFVWKSFRLPFSRHAESSRKARPVSQNQIRQRKQNTGKEALRKEVLLFGLWLTAGIYQYSFCRYEMDLAAPLLQFPVDSLCQLLLPAVR